MVRLHSPWNWRAYVAFWLGRLVVADTRSALRNPVHPAEHEKALRALVALHFRRRRQRQSFLTVASSRGSIVPTFSEIQAALMRCMSAEPPVGEHLALSADSNQLADVYAEMAFFRQEERSLDALKPKQRAAFERWSKVD